MKKIYNILMAAAISLGTFTSCEDVPMPFNNPLDYLKPDPEVVVIDPVGNGTKESPYNVAGALAYIQTLEADVESPKDIYITGVITAVKEAFSTQYGNAQFIISDTDEGTNQFTFYRGLYLGNVKYSNETEININEGDVVVICGKVVNFKGSTPETVQNKAYVVSINGKTVEPKTTPAGDPKGKGTLEDPYNAAGANAFIASLAADTESDKDIYVKGKIIDIEEKNQFNTQYGNATFYISDDGSDGGAKFYVFRTLYLGNKKYTEGDLPKKGDEVIICGKVINYKGNTPETVTNKSYIYSLNGKTGGGGGGETAKTVGTIDNPQTVTQAVEAINKLGDNESTEANYYVKGKITQIKTKDADIPKYKNIDYIISDGTSEMTVFRGKNLDNTDFTEAGQINVGDEVVVFGKLTKFVKGENVTPEMAQGNYIVKLTKGENGGGGGGSETAKAGTTADNPFTPKQANEFILSLTADENSSENYYIKGKIIEITDKNQFNAQYGNCTFYISDDGTDKDDKFYVFRTLYLGNKKYTEGTLPKAGDEVIICGKVVNYKGNTPETVANKSYIYSLNGKTE